MGNQGTKNWKLGAFFAVSLMLIAGLFSNAAIAGDGDGTITVEWDAGAEGTPSEITTGDPLPAAGSSTLSFEYKVPAGTNMSGGMLQILIPSGWTPVKIEEDITTGPDADDVDESTLFQHVTITSNDAENTGSLVTLLGTNETERTDVAADDDITEAGKVTTLAADKIEVTLGTNWSDGGTLTIELGNVTVATPSSLAFIGGPNTQPYASYQFTTRSKAKGGIFTRLKPTTIDGNPVDPQPHVRVSNIIAGAGAVTIEPTVSYEGEEVTFAIAFKAAGPMYDFEDPVATDTDSDIEIRIHPDRGTAGVAAPVEDDPKVSLSRTRGSVRFEAERIAVSSDGVITINISRMNKDDEVHISYGPIMIAADIDADDDSFPEDVSVFEVRTRTDGDDATTTDDALADDSVKGGRTQAKEGSGTVTLSPDVVDAGKTNRTFTLTYKADTEITGDLVITVGGIDPDDPSTEGDDNIETNLTLSTTSGNYAYVSSPDTDITPEVAEVSSDITPTITWTGITVKKGASFRTVVAKVNVSETTGTYEWTHNGGRYNTSDHAGQSLRHRDRAG